MTMALPAVPEVEADTALPVSAALVTHRQPVLHRATKVVMAIQAIVPAVAAEPQQQELMVLLEVVAILEV
jgi:hypothetical protein